MEEKTAADTQPLPTTSRKENAEDEDQGSTALKEAIFKCTILKDHPWRSWCLEDTFLQLATLLSSHPEPQVRVECSKVLEGVAGRLQSHLSSCMRATLPALVANLDIDDQDGVVCQWAARATVALVEQSSDPSPFLNVLQVAGDVKVIRDLPLLFSKKLLTRDWSPVVQLLCAAQLDDQHPQVGVEAAKTLRGLRGFLGPERFAECCRGLDPPTLGSALREDTEDTEGDSEDEDIPCFSFVPDRVIHRLMDSCDWRLRVQGAEELLDLMSKTSDVESLELQCGEMVSFLDRLLGDPNFKVALVALEVLALLVDKLKYRIKGNLEAVVDTLARHLGGPKIVIRTETLRVFRELMRCVGAALVVKALTSCLHHRHSRVREEILNVVIVAILTFPSYEFDMKDLCESLAVTLVDDKRRVRHAALECFAVLAQAMGSSKLATLVTAVGQLGTQYDTEGALAAVIARLARRQLPKVGVDGTVQYSVRVVSGSGRGLSANQTQETDVQWILAGSGTSSARSLREGSQEGHFVPVWRPQAASFPGSPAASRRTVSPSRCRIKLPWEDCGVNRGMARSQSWRALSSTSMGAADKDGGQNVPNPPRVSSWTDLKTADPVNPALRPGTSHKRGFSDNGWRNHSGDRGTRPMDKVANMLGGSILPNKVWPLSETEKAGTWSKPGFIPPLSPEGSLNSTWPSVPKPVVGLTGHKRVLGPISNHGQRTRLTSGRRVLKVPPIGHSPELEDCEDEGVDEVELEDVKETPGFGHRQTVQDFKYAQKREVPKDPGPRRPKSLDLRLAYSLSDMSSLMSSSKEDDYEDGDYEMEMATPTLSKSSSSSSSYSLPRPLRAIVPEERAIKVLPDYGAHRRSASLDRARIVKWKSSLSWELVDSKLPPPLEKPKAEETLPPFMGKPVIVRSPALNRQRVTTNGTEGPLKLNNNGIKPNGYVIAPRARIESINVVGRGVLPAEEKAVVTPSSPPTVTPQAVSPPLPALRNLSTHQTVTSDDRNLPSVQGVPFPTKTREDDSCSPEDEALTTSLSRSTFNKMLSKKKEFANAERKKAERQKRLYHQRKTFNEEITVQDLDTVEKNNTPNVVRPRPPPGKPPTFTRKRNKIASTNSVDLYSNSTGSLTSLKMKEDTPITIRNPDDSLRTALTSLDNPEWAVKCEGIRIITALARNHPNTVYGEVHTISLALVNEVKNLRSTVARAALSCFGDLFDELKKNMESELELICRTLLHKSGESNAFIKEDVERALLQMADNVSPQRSIPALVAGGANHRNPAVRKMTAGLLVVICEKLGPSKMMSGAKDLTERIIPTAAVFVTDGSPLTRYYGRKIFDMVLAHPDFDKVLRQYLQPTTLRNIRDILDGLKSKGLGSMPNDSASMRAQRTPK